MRKHAKLRDKLPPLVAGPYVPPPCRPGDWINDELLGLVEVAGFTAAPLSWPRRKHRGLPVLIVTPELVRAVRTESRQVLALWLGVSGDRIWRWRREFDVGRATPGTSQLLAKQGFSAERQAELRELANAPEARERAAAKRRGKPAHPRTREALQRGREQPKPEGLGARANAWMNAAKKR